MKYFFILIFLFFIPSAFSLTTDPDTYQKVYEKTFDADYDTQTVSGQLWDNSGYRFYGNVDGGETKAVLRLDASPPAGYTFYGRLLATDVDECSDSFYSEIRYDSSLGIDNLWGSMARMSYDVTDASYRGTWRLRFYDDDFSSWSNGYLVDNLVGGWTLQTYWFNSSDISYETGLETVDKIAIMNYATYSGCSAPVTAGTLFANLTFWNLIDAPARLRVYDDTNDVYLSGVNVTIIGEDSELTDALGYTFKNKWANNGSYTVTISKNGYYSRSISHNFQPCNTNLLIYNTIEDYREYCSSTYNVYEVPESGDIINYKFEIVNILNQPLNHTFISLGQTQYPYAQISNYTDINGLTNFDIGKLTTYDYTITLSDYKDITGSFSTNITNITQKYVMLEDGCSHPDNIFPEVYSYVDVNVTDFSESHTQTFIFELESTGYLQSYYWELDGKLYAFNYPTIDITFTETGDRYVQVFAIQTGCIESWGWFISLQDYTVPESIENYTTTRQFTKESFFAVLLYVVPTAFVIVILFSAWELFNRIGKKTRFRGKEG